jgi:hypothetical protein
MKSLCILFCLLLIIAFSNAQSLEPLEEGIENSITTSVDADNNQTENSGSSLNEQFDYFKDKPIDLNQISGEELANLFYLNSVQIKSFIIYRNMLGYFIDFHELQSLPGWDLTLLTKIRPYVYVSTSRNLSSFLHSNFINQKSLFLLRYINSFIVTDSLHSHSLAFKYNYDSRKNVSIGLIGENDSGEKFGFEKNKNGFDFTSGYISYKGKVFLKSLIAGDFVINLGQGLIHWQSAGFNKGASVDCIKRQDMTLKPYRSFGEFNFHRGVAIQFEKKELKLTSFLSSKKLDAYTNFDTVNYPSQTVSSFDYSGLHNTVSSSNRKSNVHEFVGGCSLQYQKHGFLLGVNFVHYNYSIPIKPKSVLPYAIFSFNGQKLSNLSFHYAKTINNFHFFGELASDFYHLAIVNGTIISISEKTELSFLHRMISRAYHSFYSNAFTAQTKPTNETGFYSAINMKLSRQIHLNGFIDFYKFPWLTYSVNSPSGGIESGLTMTFLPTKKTKLNFFFGYKKDMNFQSEVRFSNENSNCMKKNYRLDAEFHISKSFSVKTRITMSQIKKIANTSENGSLSFVDLHYKPLMKPFSATLRMFSFETEGYNSRIYAYENDIMYTYSMNSFYGSGKGFYLNSSYKFNKRLRLEAKWSMNLKGQNDTSTQFNWQKSQLKLQILTFF